MTMPAPAKDRPMKAATAPAIVQPTISDADFLKFREFFYRKTGIHFEESKRYFVDKRLIERIEATGADSFRAYFIALRFEAERVVKAKVTSAAALPAAELETIKAALRKRFGREVEVETAIDASLIGGALIDAGDVVIDGSIKGKLERLQSALTN